MLNSSADLQQLREIFLQIFDRLFEQEALNQNFEQRISRLEQDAQRQEDRVEFLESEIPGLRYCVARNAELEYAENPYSLDGEPRCNS
ncbi:MAG: hypothetical protein MUC48_18805 [Leptolyngbya sp. Prado105]|jgi:predicted ribosome quality control (RQC) complex YloA/Tae2 family protein|nr:hypothetical protein [Leptolyngbya sp. Prado105]